MSLCRERAKSGAFVRKIVWACLLWCCAAAAVETCAWGQTAVDGAISGFVVDAGGRALPGAVVQVQSVASGTTARMTTGGRGEFLVGHLPAGEYRVVVDFALFARLTLQPVIVELGGVALVEARLRVGGVATSVTVKAEPGLPVSVGVANLSSGADASVVTPDEIERLPVNGRRWQTFAQLVPGVNVDPEGDGSLSFRGVASTQNSSRVDGGDDDQSFGSVPRGTGPRAERRSRTRRRSGFRDASVLGARQGVVGMGGTRGWSIRFRRRRCVSFG